MIIIIKSDREFSLFYDSLLIIVKLADVLFIVTLAAMTIEILHQLFIYLSLFHYTEQNLYTW